MIDHKQHISEIIKSFEELNASKKRNSDSTSRQLQLCKKIFDVQQHLVGSNHFGLTELYIDGFDTEQIFQQIELTNTNLYKVIEEAIKQDKSNPKIQTKENTPIEESVENYDDVDEEEESDDERVKEIKKRVKFADVKDETDETLFDDFSGDEEEGEDDENEDEEQEEEGEDVDEDEDEFKRKAKKPRLDAKSNSCHDPMEMFRKSIKDSKKSGNASEKDRFFNMSEMNAFLDKQDALAGKDKKRDDSDDNSDDLDDYDEDSQIKYDDFFDQPDDDDDGEGEEEDNGDDEPPQLNFPTKESTNLSSFEKRVEMMRKKASQLEDKSVSEKQWQMRGEVTHEDRPVNSLIDKQVEFGVATQPALITTPEIMKKIEEILCQRATSQVWDGPKRKIKTKEAAFTLNKKVVLDQEKSKLSLAEIYENEYLEQIKGKEEKLPEEVEEIQTSMRSLFRKLDALTNFHFNPKPAVPDVKIITNAAAMAIEEVAPVAMSEAMTLAPEEILEKSKKGLLGETERSETDKKRANRLRKKKQHFIKLDKEEREKVKKLKAEKRVMHKSGTDAHLDKEIKKKPKKSGKKKFVRNP